MLTQIENALKQCNGDIFANICRQYLSYEYKSVLASGFVLGKEKSKKGTPDNFIPYKGYYIFNEITTVEKDLINKLKKDIQHCFVQKDIPSKKISKVILICNSKVSPNEYHELSEFKNIFDSVTKLEVVGIDDLATRIYKDYHSIVRQLGIPIDTGQILELDGFLHAYEKSKFATTLSNKFFNRKKEVKTGVETLSKSDILLLFGKAGVGKTKLSLELTKLFYEKNPDYQIKYIINNANLDIWDDLKIQILNNKNYLIVVDDANKLQSNLELIMNFVRREKRQGKIKLLLTVRNYVKFEVEEKIGEVPTIELNNFTREELTNILESDEFNITPFYIDKIFSVSKGNPRLAIMAAKAGIKDKKKLDNAYFIHEEYFSSQGDLSLSQNADFLKTSGVLALLKNIDLENNELIIKIGSHFQVSKKKLIENLKQLYTYEVADEYEGIYKISDQILAEYLFFETFIKKKVVSFQYLLETSIKDTSFNVSNLLTPIINNYGFEYVKGFILKDLITVSNQLENHLDKVKFFKEFWFYLPTDCLVFLKNYIDSIDQNEIENFKFEIFKDNHIDSYEDKIFDILLNFKQFNDYFRASVELFINYGLKNQLNFSKLLKVFTEGLTYGYYSSNTNYSNQIELFDILYAMALENKVFSEIILFIANKYLVHSFQTARNNGLQVEIHQKRVLDSIEQLEFRTKLFRYIFSCFRQGYKEGVYSFFFKYLTNHGYHTNLEILNHDKDLILEFFTNNFSKLTYKECSIVDKFISKLDRKEVDYPKGFNNGFISKEFLIYLKLSENKLKLRDFDGDYERFEDYKKNEVENFVGDYSLEDFKLLLKTIDFIYEQENSKFHGYSSLNESIIYILEYLAKDQFSVFVEVIKESFLYDFSSQLLYGRLFSFISLNQQKGEVLVSTLETSAKGSSYLKSFWVESNNYTIAKKDVELFRISVFEQEEISLWLVKKVLEKVSSELVDKKGFIIEVLDMVIARKNEIEGWGVSNDFFIYAFEISPEIFDKRIKEIKDLYIYLSKNVRSFDFNLPLLKIILLRDSDFINQFLKSHFDDKDWFSKREMNSLNLDKLWGLSNFKEVFKNLLIFFSKEKNFWLNTPDDLGDIFQNNNEKQIQFLIEFIVDTDSIQEILKVYNIVVSKFNDFKLEFLQIILDKNADIFLFKKLEFYVLSRVYSGSRIPRLRYAISQNELILNYLKNKDQIKYLEHINYVEKEIFNKKISIEWERKREFINKMGW